ncbi:MAG: hypothetical protein KJI69_01240 [Patescibacteria group bacterium]|nr:hypothetical protein [Patescibacteria group bacterium]
MTTDRKTEEQIIGRELALLVISSNRNIRRVLDSKASIDEPLGKTTILRKERDQCLLEAVGDTAEINRLISFFEESKGIEILDKNRSRRVTVPFPKNLS